MVKRTTRASYQRRPSKKLDDTGKYLLTVADEILRRSSNLDTAVRDSIAHGLAYIVHAGNDCTASNMKQLTTDQWMSSIDLWTADWFRSRGFAEWFCLGAACLFNKSRPRTLQELGVRVVKTKRK